MRVIHRGVGSEPMAPWAKVSTGSEERTGQTQGRTELWCVGEVVKGDGDGKATATMTAVDAEQRSGRTGSGVSKSSPRSQSRRRGVG